MDLIFIIRVLPLFVDYKTFKIGDIGNYAYLKLNN